MPNITKPTAPWLHLVGNTTDSSGVREPPTRVVFHPGELPAAPGCTLKNFIEQSVSEEPRVRLERLYKRHDRAVLSVFKGLGADLRADLAQETWRVLLERFHAKDFAWFSVDGVGALEPIHEAYNQWRIERSKRNGVYETLARIVRSKGDRRERLTAPKGHRLWHAIGDATGFDPDELFDALFLKDVVFFSQAFVRMQAKGVLSNYIKHKKRWKNRELLVDPDSKSIRDFADTHNVEVFALARELNALINDDKLAWIALTAELSTQEDADMFGIALTKLQSRMATLRKKLEEALWSLQP